MALPNEVSSLLIGAAANQGGYQIDNSLRFRGSQYLSRTLGTTSSSWTVSFWTKTAHNDNNDGYWFNTSQTAIYMDASSGAPSDRRWKIRDNSTGSLIVSNALIRDPSAWYHVVYKCDGSNRRLYINNSLDAGFTFSGSTTLSGSSKIGAYYTGSGAQLEGYIAEFYFVDGQALDPTSFGEYNNDGVWVPKAVGVTYGTNGFYLDFSDPSNIGADRSGNNNNFTASGFELTTTSSTNYDWMSDSPTNNSLTYNPTGSLMRGGGSFSAANLQVGGWSGNYSWARGSESIRTDDSDGWYCEWTQVSDGAYNFTALWDQDWGREWSTNAGNGIGVNTAADVGISFGNTGELNNYGTYLGNYGAWRSAGDVIMCAIKGNKIWFGKNGSWYSSGNPSSGTNQLITLSGNKNVAFSVGGSNSGGQMTINGGIRPFKYTVPTGFKSVSSSVQPEVDVTDPRNYFDVVTYSGNSSTQNITGLAFQPDMVAIKCTSTGSDWWWFDSVRGATKLLKSVGSGGEETDSNTLTSFNSNGFTLGNSTSNAVNISGRTYIAYCWKRSSVSGFDVVTYTGNGTSQSISHNCGHVPGTFWTKRRQSGYNWMAYSQGSGATRAGYLNLDNAWETASGFWNNTAPTSSTFTVGNGASMNGSGGTFVAYLFGNVPGFCASGQYKGNSSTDGVFTYTGFRPSVVIIKLENAGGGWCVYDAENNSYNPIPRRVFLNKTNAYDTAGTPDIDFLSNGFKLRTSEAYTNNSSYLYNWVAFAEHPFVGENVSPSPAR